MNTKKLNTKTQFELIEDYVSYKYSNRELMNKYKISSTATLYRYLNNGCRHAIISKKRDYARKYKFNYKFFKKIETEIQSYWLGFLMADGWVSSNKYRIGLSLQIQDKDHLYKLANCINMDSSAIKEGVQKNIKLNGVLYEKYKYAIINIYSREMAQDLIHKGCVPCKSLIINFPSCDLLSEELQRHFIRGYLDGDGSILKWKNKNEHRLNYGIMISSGSKNFLIKIQNILMDKCDLKSNKILQHKNSNTFVLRYSGNRNSRKILSYLYDNSTISLYRKYQIYQNFLTLENRHCGEDNDYRAMVCEFEDNNGKIIKFSNLRKFCRENSEYRKSRSRLMDLYHGKILFYKGLKKHVSIKNEKSTV